MHPLASAEMVVPASASPTAMAATIAFLIAVSTSPLFGLMQTDHRTFPSDTPMDPATRLGLKAFPVRTNLQPMRPTPSNPRDLPAGPPVRSGPCTVGDVRSCG